MKNIIKLILPFFIIAHTYASNNEEEFKEILPKYCESVSNYASSIMKIRQDNHLASDVLKHANENFTPETAEIKQDIIIRAYKTPKLIYEENKEETIINFKNKIFIECLTTDKHMPKKIK